MLKKTKTAVITALATMLSTVSPIAVYAENAEHVHTIPERTISQDFHPYATAPAVLDNQPAQTTAVVSTIPDREYTMTNIMEVEIQPDAFPITNKTDVTVSVVDGDTGEKIDGVTVHLIETDDIHSSTVKRDFGTWNTSDYENYVVHDVEYTLTNLSSMFVMTAYLENVPEGYTYQGSYSPAIADRMIDSGTGRYYNLYDPVDDFTIKLYKEYSGSFQAECSVIDIKTGEKIKGAEVALEEWGIDGNLKNTQSWITSGGKSDIVDVNYTLPADYFNEMFDFRVCKLPDKYDNENMTTGLVYSQMINKDTSGVLEFYVYLYPSDMITTAPEDNSTTQTVTSTTVFTDIPENFQNCGICGKTIHKTQGVISSLGIFVCQDCKSSGAGGTRPHFPDNESTQTATTTATTANAVTRECDLCGKNINKSDGVISPLGLFLCPDCKSSGAGGTRPQFTDDASTGTITVTTVDYITCGNCKKEIKLSEATSTPLGLLICTDCQSVGLGGTKPYPSYPHNTETGNLIQGDINYDNEVNISDAVLIMQVLSNPNEYKMNDAQKEAADVCNKGDGVTAMDAFVIQMIGIKVYSVSDLPITL